jgi:hypothetical protein
MKDFLSFSTATLKTLMDPVMGIGNIQMLHSLSIAYKNNDA